MLLLSFWEDQSVISKLAASHLHHCLVHVCIFWLFFFQFLIVCQTAFQVRVIWYAWTTFFTFGIYNLEPCKSEHKHSPTTHKLPTTYQLITSTSKNFRSYELFEFSPSEAKSLSATFLRLHILHSWGALHFSFNGLSAPHQSGTVVEFMDSLLPALIYIFDSLMIQPDFIVFHWVFLREKKFRYGLCSSNETALQFMHSVAATSLDNTGPDDPWCKKVAEEWQSLKKIRPAPHGSVERALNCKGFVGLRFDSI